MTNCNYGIFLLLNLKIFWIPSPKTIDFSEIIGHNILKIADTMTSYGRKIDVKTVEKYLNALMERINVLDWLMGDID